MVTVTTDWGEGGLHLRWPYAEKGQSVTRDKEIGQRNGFRVVFTRKNGCWGRNAYERRVGLAWKIL